MTCIDCSSPNLPCQQKAAKKEIDKKLEFA
ncbi:MAG: hypothetical protein PWP64_1590 [Candidatus Cloacimonadota bacterium]|nr:hypothetical protein [Candidatus Cloacimonadota bacterium]